MIRKQRLQALLLSLETSEPPKEGLAIEKGDFLDEASRVSEQAVTTELLRHRNESIRKLKEALAWGLETCSSCGEEIGEKRLIAIPWAIKCVGCQEREERGLRDVGEAKRLKNYYQSQENNNAKFFASKEKRRRGLI